MAHDVKFDISEIKDFADKVKQLADDMPELMQEFVAQETEAAIGRIKALTPRDTGHLINSWHSKPPVKRGKIYIGAIVNNAEYASFVEHGHRIVNKNGDTVGYVKGKFMSLKGLQFYKQNDMAKNAESFFGEKARKYLDK